MSILHQVRLIRYDEIDNGLLQRQCTQLRRARKYLPFLLVSEELELYPCAPVRDEKGREGRSRRGAEKRRDI